MAESNTTTLSLGGVWFALFIAIKLAGTSLATWSWWWFLMPIVPILAVVVKHFGL